MRPTTQGLLLAVLGAVLLRISLTDEYLRYVVEWMKWPLLASGVFLLVMAAGPLLRAGTAEDTAEPETNHAEDHPIIDAHGHGVPRVTWLLVLPAIITFVITPPALGAFLAERRAGDAASVQAPAEVTALDSSAGPIDLAVDEFLWRAADGGTTLEEQTVKLTGFVSYADGGESWFVTRISIGCCAADGSAYRVKVSDAPAPARDEWVEVVGTHESGTGKGVKDDPVIVADSVTVIDPPDQTYQ